MDAEVVELAERQRGLVAPWQLRALGRSRSAVRWALRDGRLTAFGAEVLAVGARPDSREARWMAAVLRAGPGALLSHHPAGVLWKLLGAADQTHVTTPGAVRSRADLRVHRSVVSGADRTVRDGIPVTALPRTLVDLADVLEPAALATAVERVPHLDVRTMRRCLDRHPGRRANGVLRRLLDAYDPETRSVLEDAFRALCRRQAVPPPLVNARIEGAERDFAWPEVGLVIELDGQAFHASRAQRNQDSRRDVDLGIAGWRPHRLTYERVMLDPAGTAAAVLALYSATSRR